MDTGPQSAIPRDSNFDSTLALLSDGYTFVSKRCAFYRSDVFETRLMFTKVFCALGEEAARTFYHPGRFTRQRAMPTTVLRLLQDKGSVQLLDGDAHHWRKQIFMSLMTTDSIRQLVQFVADQWNVHIRKWEAMDEVVLLDEAQEILCAAVCRWAGIPLTDSELRQRTQEFAAMIDGAGAVGPRNWRGLVLRWGTERWSRKIIEAVRAGTLAAPAGSATHVIANHRDLQGEPLPPAVASVELLNVLRPTVAVAWYIAFAAVALHTYPECRRVLEAGEDEYLGLFVQEVRRFYPFFPAVGGRVQQEFDWRGHHFAKGAWMLLDLYGTNHDVRIWNDPHLFRPERFRRWNENAFSFIPQGGGDSERGHRCPGEWITIELMKVAVRMLTRGLQYQVPDQDLGVDLSRMPAIPESRVVITSVRRTERQEVSRLSVLP